MRRKRHPQLEIPADLIALAQREQPDFDAALIASRLAGAGAVVIEALGDNPDRPEGIRYETAGQGGWVDVLYDDWPTPITTALEELALGLAKFDQLGRLHSAMIDMELVAEAARALVEARTRDPGTDPIGSLGEVVEVGIFAMYARSFTGRASIGDRWRPLDEADRRLHEQVIAARNAIHVHSDWNPQRALRDINAIAAGWPDTEPPPDAQLGVAYAEVRQPVPSDFLLALAAMCERQHARMYEETYWLKVGLGFLPPPPESEC